MKGGCNWLSLWCLGFGILLVIVFFKYLYELMYWVVFGVVVVGVLLIVVKVIVVLRKFFFDINIFMFIVGNIFCIGFEIMFYLVGYFLDLVYCFVFLVIGKELVFYIIRKVFCIIS